MQSVSQRLICFGNLALCHSEKEVTDQTCCLTQSQYSDTRPTSPSTGSIVTVCGKVATGVSVLKSQVSLVVIPGSLTLQVVNVTVGHQPVVQKGVHVVLL